jgi:septal ring factor EnvC (AmiA/AmiB activator)
MLRLFYRRFLSVALLAGLLLSAVGRTPLWSQSSDLKLSDSDSISLTWSELYSQGQKIYEQQSSTLASLNREIQTLRTGYDELMSLSGQLSQSNESLKVFNEQIGQRMQERDQDLAWAYDDLDEKDLTIAKKNTLIWKLVAIVIAMGAVIIGAVAFTVFKFVVKKKIPIF